MNAEIAPAEKLRQHLLFVHQYVLASLLVIEEEEGKPFVFEKLISRYDLNAFVQRNDDSRKEFKIGLRDALRAYACYDCMNCVFLFTPRNHDSYLYEKMLSLF